MIARVSLAGLLVAGCAHTPPPVAAEPAGTCHAGSVQDLVGKTGGQALYADAKRRSGALQLRRIPPDAAVTMDYRTDRLDVTVDAAGKIVSLRCG